MCFFKNDLRMSSQVSGLETGNNPDVPSCTFHRIKSFLSYSTRLDFDFCSIIPRNRRSRITFSALSFWLWPDVTWSDLACQEPVHQLVFISHSVLHRVPDVVNHMAVHREKERNSSAFNHWSQFPHPSCDPDKPETLPDGSLQSLLRHQTDMRAGLVQDPLWWLTSSCPQPWLIWIRTSQMSLDSLE